MNLKRLKIETDLILEEAFAVKDEEWCVNWGDLRCVSAERYETDDGFVGHRVIIEEASPDNNDFRNWVYEKLNERGIKEVEVQTEW